MAEDSDEDLAFAASQVSVNQEPEALRVESTFAKRVIKKRVSSFSPSNNLVHFHWPKSKKTPNRLINIKTLELEIFPDVTPPYAILSHRWGDNEVTFDSYSPQQKGNTSGLKKIVDLCIFVQHLNVSGQDGKQDYMGPLVQYVWVDTCCIDKRSSAELSEAVNSMADWYKHSAFCVAYLSDVVNAEADDWKQFRTSEWFKRGWTLQELIFPPSVAFCTRDWHQFLWMNPFRKPATALVSDISGVPQSCLRNSRAVSDESIATRMSWAAHRETTRKEDEAYCLLGLLDINMPLIYGEGEKAFRRLQEEIIKQVDDESIFAWTMSTNSWRMFPILAASPAQFRGCNVVRRQIKAREPYSVTNQGLEFSSPTIRLVDLWLGSNLQKEVLIVQLNCCYVTDAGQASCLIALVRRTKHEQYRRIHPERDVWQVLHGRAEHADLGQSAQMIYIALDPQSRKTTNITADDEAANGVPTLNEYFQEIPKEKQRYLDY